MGEREEPPNADKQVAISDPPTTKESSFPGLLAGGGIPAVSSPLSDREEVKAPQEAHERRSSTSTGSEVSSHAQSRHVDDDLQAEVARPTLSRTSTIHDEAVKVPVRHRRGLLSRCTVIAEVTQPHDYPRRTKWIITAVVAIAAVAGPMGSNIILRMSRVKSFLSQVTNGIQLL